MKEDAWPHWYCPHGQRPASWERCCFPHNSVTFSTVFIPDTCSGTKKAAERDKTTVQSDLQSRVSAAQLMFIKNGIYS